MVGRHQERLIDGMPWSLQTSFYPMRLAERTRTACRAARNKFALVSAREERRKDVTPWRMPF